MNAKPKPRKNIFFAVLILVGFLLPLYARSLYEARHLLRQGIAHVIERKSQAAIDDFRGAIAWNAPFNVYSDMAAQQLLAYARNGITDPALKLEAYRSLKSGLKSSRSFLAPYSEGARDAFAQMVDQELSQLENPTQAPPAVVDMQMPKVDYFFQICAQVCFWAWVASVLWTIAFGFQMTGELKRARALGGIVSSVIFYVAWLFALSLA